VAKAPRASRALSDTSGQPGPLVLGIDPGTRVVGYGAVRLGGRRPRCIAAGVLRARAGPVPERLGEIAAGLERLLLELAPQVVVVEEAFAARNVQSALRIGEGRGVALAVAARFGARIVQLPPAVAKKAVVGHGGAAKEQVAAMVARLLGLAAPPEPADVTDALALALTYLARPAGVHAGGAGSGFSP
jgi:crossover junction endodeoxyribonuclease RuvC